MNGSATNHSLEDFPEHNVASVQPRGHFRRDEKLRSVSILPGVRHGQPAGAEMLQFEIFVFEPLSINASPSGPVSSSEISALDHEIFDDSVERGALVSLSLGFLRQLLEVPGSFWYSFPEESDFNPSSRLSPNSDFEPNLK